MSCNFLNLWLAEANVDVVIGPVLEVFSDVEEDVGCFKVIELRELDGARTCTMYTTSQVCIDGARVLKKELPKPDKIK